MEQFESTPASVGCQETPYASDDLATRVDDEWRWGPWRFSAKALCLVFDPRSEGEAGGDVAYRARGYGIDLRECRDSHQILNWVAQLQDKSWIAPNVIGHLMRAFDDLLNLRALKSAIDDDDIPSRVAAFARRRRAWADFRPGESISISELISRTLHGAGVIQ